MYQTYKISGTDPDSDTLDHALDLIVQGGPKGFSLRNLAQKAGISASLLNYRYGSRDALLERTLEHACRRNTRLWNRRTALFAHTPLSVDDLPAILFATVSEIITAGRKEFLAGWFCQTQAVRDGLYHDIARRWHADSATFWREVLISAGQAPTLAPGLSAAMTSACRIGLVAGDDPIAAAWLYDTLQRIKDRLLRRPVSRKGDSPWRAQKENPLSLPPPRQAGETASTPDKIIDAAVKIIVESGPDALTHRAIAERAGVSLSSTTHHFASLDDILASAFSLIYADIRQQPVVSTELAQARTMETLLNILTEQALPGQRVAEREVMAMDEIMLAAARRPETQAIATGLLASVGRTSTTMLQTLEGKRDDTDRLDGQILRFIITGLQEQVAVSDEAHGEAWFREHFEHIATHFYC